MPHFFKDKPVERLLGPGITAERLNDDTLGRALDSIYEYGPQQLYSQLAGQAVTRLGLSCATGSIDTTSFHTDGEYNSAQEDVPQGCIQITEGFSRDHRPDLNQVVLQLISEQQAGIPLLMTSLSGNSSDKESFRHTLNEHLTQLREGVGLSLIVADSALYTALGSNYGCVAQRWLVVYTRAAHERAEQTVNKRYLKQSHAEYQAFQTLTKQSFACQPDAEAALAQFQKTLKVTAVYEPQLITTPGYKGKGRPAKNRTPDTITYRITAGLASILETRQRVIQQKCCFILASNQLDEAQLSHEELIAHYTPGQQKVELGFRFLKDPWFMAQTLFLKSPTRIMALMMIMTLCLAVYGALDHRIRQTLKEHEETFPH